MLEVVGRPSEKQTRGNCQEVVVVVKQTRGNCQELVVVVSYPAVVGVRCRLLTMCAWIAVHLRG